MNTLQKVAELEQEVSLLKQKLAVFETLAVSMPKAIQDIGRINQDIDTLSKGIQNVVNGVSKRTADLSMMDNMIITRLMGLEQSSAALSKTIACVVSELSDTKVLDQVAVMTRMRKSDEEAEKSRVQQLLSLKVVKESEETVKDSMIVVAQNFTDKDGKTDVIAEYRTYELSSPELSEEERQKYVGRRVGDVVELNLEDGVLKTTILQVYDYVQQYAEAKAEQGTEDKPEAEVKQ